MSNGLPYPLDWRVNQTTLIFGQATARFKMSRGVTRINDRVKTRHVFVLNKIEGNDYIFKGSNSHVRLRIEHTAKKTVLHLPVDARYNRLTLFLAAHPDERIYGCGEQFTHFNLKGLTVPIWVSEHHALSALLRKFLRERFWGVNPDHRNAYQKHHTYFTQPTFLSSAHFALHADTDEYTCFTFSSSQTQLHFHGSPKTLTLFHHPEPMDLVGQLSQHLGIQPALPAWLHNGTVLAVQGGIETALEKLSVAQKNGIAVSALWAQDWSGTLQTRFGTQVHWHWQVDALRYQNLAMQIAKLKQEGIRFLGYINPYLRKGTPLCDVAQKQGFLVKKRSGKPYWFVSTTFSAGMIDLTHPEARLWFKTLIQREMIDLGLAGWMADFGEYLPPDALVHAGSGAAWHNRWPVLWAALNREAIDERGKQDDVFFFSRAGYTGITAYANSLWTGDQHVDYSEDDGLPSAVRALLSMAVTGVGISHSDIGGYTTLFHMKRTPELFIRWAELAVFTPVFRSHEGNRPTDNAQFDHPNVLKHFAFLSQLHAALAPYIKHVLDQYQATGVPAIRPLFFQDAHFDFQDMDDQFMLGDDLVVVPILKPKQRLRRCRLPEGRWRHLFSGYVFEGGTHTLDCPLGKPLVFSKEDSLFKDLFAHLISLADDN